MVSKLTTSALGAVLLLAGCNREPQSEATTTGGERCEGAALEYRDVCFFPHSVEAMGYRHPLDLNSEPGHELIDLADGKVAVYKWNGDGFDLIGDAETPPKILSPLRVVSGEFDDDPGLDLIVSESGEWATLYHLDSAGRPTLVQTTSLSGVGNTHGFEASVAVGPDADGRWRVVAYFDDDDEFAATDPLALWEVQGGTLVDERLELPTEACEIEGCSAGDFNADGRQDAVCTLREYCAEPTPDEDIVHVVLLAQADGSVSVEAYPTSIGPGSFIEGDLNGDGVSDLVSRAKFTYRLGDGTGGFEAAVLGELPLSPDLWWRAVSLGDIDGDTDGEFVLGEQSEMLVLQEFAGDPGSHERITLDGFEFGAIVGKPIDVNGDGISDLPLRYDVLLVSQVIPDEDG